MVRVNKNYKRYASFHINTFSFIKGGISTSFGRNDVEKIENVEIPSSPNKTGLSNSKSGLEAFSVTITFNQLVASTII